MSETPKYYTGQDLPVRERITLRVPHPLGIDDFKTLALEPITIFSTTNQEGHKVNGVVKLNQYTVTPYEIALFPTHRSVSELTDLNTDEGKVIMGSVYNTATSMKRMLGDSANITIGINQHHNVENLPAEIERGSEQVPTRVQTIDQLHIHVYADLPGQDKVKPFSELEKARQREIRDPYIFTAAELLSPYVEPLQAEHPEIWGETKIQDRNFPLGLNITLPQGLETIATEPFFTGLQTLQNAYKHEYEQITNCLVDTNITDNYGMFQVRLEKERVERIETYLQSHPELSDYTEIFLRKTAKQHASFAEVEKHYHTFVRGAAFTLGIYQNEQKETVLNWQPRVISRGNVLSSFGIFRNGMLIPDERKNTLIDNAHSQLFETMRSMATEPTNLSKGQRIDTYTPHLDTTIREEAIQKASEQLSYYPDPRGSENILRNLLNGSAIELSRFQADPMLINGRHLEIEAYLMEKVQRESLPSRIFDRDILYHKDNQEARISSNEQQTRLSEYLRYREQANPAKWGATITDIIQAHSDEPGVIRNHAGEVIYSEQEQTSKIAAIGTKVKASLSGQGITPLAFYGRAKNADTILYLLTSHHKGVSTLSDIEDLTGTRVVVEDLDQVEQSVTALEETLGKNLLYKRNLYAEPYPHAPLFRSTFLYFHDDEENITELQICTRNASLLSNVGHALEFKPKLEENKEHVTELLHIPPEEVTSSHLLQITKYPFESVRKRLETEAWLDYMGNVEGLSELQPAIRKQVYRGLPLYQK